MWYDVLGPILSLVGIVLGSLVAHLVFGRRTATTTEGGGGSVYFIFIVFVVGDDV